MAKLGSIPQHSTNGQSDVVVGLCSLGLMLCMVIGVLGIKLRWFKKRIHFDQIPTGSSGSSENGGVILKRSSRNFQEQFSEPVVAQGIFRKKLDEDVIIERPKTLPPIRIRKTSRPLTFGPPKRQEIPTTVVEEPVVIPPPPPPLPPSASTLSLSALGGSVANHHATPTTEDKVNYSESASTALGGSVANHHATPTTEDKVNYSESASTLSLSALGGSAANHHAIPLKEDKVNFSESTSTVSLSVLNGSVANHEGTPTIEEKVNFSESVEIIPNGNTNAEIEPLNSEEVHINRQLSGRKQTGYTRPSDEIIAELQKLSDEVSKKQNFDDEPPEPLPRTITSEKHRFIKNTSKSVKSSIDSTQNPEDEQIDTRKLGQRRLTGIFPSADDDLGDFTDLSSSSDDDEEKSNQKPSTNKVIFQVENDTDDDDERKSPSPPPILSPPPYRLPTPTITPPILFITQVSNDNEEPESLDSWSAIQRHRNLTKEINDQKEVSTPKEEEEELFVVHKVEHPPQSQPEEPKPRTMRDMKRNNARNDLLLNSERDYSET